MAGKGGEVEPQIMALAVPAEDLKQEREKVTKFDIISRELFEIKTELKAMRGALKESQDKIHAHFYKQSRLEAENESLKKAIMDYVS